MKTLFTVFFITLFLAGCRPQVDAGQRTPPPKITASSGQPIPVALSELAAKPAIYEDAIIQLTGQYAPLPRLICDSKSQPSPATWGLKSDTLLALAGGFDEQLRPLLPEGLTMTITGRWLYWEGMAGCGDSAQPQEIWYLQVSEIISPSPITQVTLTPGGIPVAFNDDTPIAEGTAVTPAPADNSPGTGETAVATNTPADSLPDQGPTPFSGQTATATTTPSINATQTGESSTPTFTPTATTTPIDERNTRLPATITPTPSATPEPGTTPTPLPTQPANATATSTPDLNNIDMGDIDPESPLMDYLGSGDRHQWTFYNEVVNNKLTIDVMAENTVDLAISITDPNGFLLLTQNNAPAGQPETISDLNLTKEGDHQIFIHAANDAAGEYALVALDSYSVALPFRAVIFNSSTNTQFSAGEEQLWFFTGTQNDVISFTAVPNSTADIGIDFIGPGDELLDFIDEPGDGVTEELTDYTLLESGLYILWLYGDGTGVISVDLLVTRN